MQPQSLVPCRVVIVYGTADRRVSENIRLLLCQWGFARSRSLVDLRAFGWRWCSLSANCTFLYPLTFGPQAVRNMDVRETDVHDHGPNGLGSKRSRPYFFMLIENPFYQPHTVLHCTFITNVKIVTSLGVLHNSNVVWKKNITVPLSQGLCFT